MKFIIVERHEAPVVSMFTHADVGAVDEIKFNAEVSDALFEVKS